MQTFGFVLSKIRKIGRFQNALVVENATLFALELTQKAMRMLSNVMLKDADGVIIQVTTSGCLRLKHEC